MPKKLAHFVLSLLLICCFAVPSVCARENTDDFTVKMKDLEQKRNQITKTYKQQMQEVDKETAKKINALKKGFHKTRNEYLQDKAGKAEQLRGDYDKKIEALDAQKEQLLSTRPEATASNFAKRRTCRD